MRFNVKNAYWLSDRVRDRIMQKVSHYLLLLMFTILHYSQRAEDCVLSTLFGFLELGPVGYIMDRTLASTFAIT